MGSPKDVSISLHRMQSYRNDLFWSRQKPAWIEHHWPLSVKLPLPTICTLNLSRLMIPVSSRSNTWQQTNLTTSRSSRGKDGTESDTFKKCRNQRKKSNECNLRNLQNNISSTYIIYLQNKWIRWTTVSTLCHKHVCFQFLLPKQ